MSRLQQDTFIDEDEEECCPLCVEEFDVQDRNFRPCPCGYQICQFCFNNIRSNLNGLCPACRRPYRDETIEYKIITAEELKAEDAKKKRAANEKRKHEAAKREIELLNRKHLSGLRVIQRNLVYVTGLNPTVKEDELLQTLRGHSYFGQYGKILKIVVNKRTAQERHGQMQSHQHDSQGLGVYVTFASKEEAERCIKSVDNTDNGGRTLRATYGTTKYCSAYLRNEACPNKSCMFLHEPGEEAESFSRLELSNANTSRQNSQTNTREQQQPYGHQPQPSRPPPREHHHPPTLTHHDSSSSLTRASASHAASSSGGDDGHSALPSTANWAKNPPTPASRPASLVHSLSNNHLPPKVSTPAPKEVPPSPLSQKVQTARKAEDSKKTTAERTKSTPQAASTPSKTPPPAADKSSSSKSLGVIGQPAPAPEPKKVVAPPPSPPVQEPEPEPAPRPPTPAPKPKRRAEPISPNYHADHRARMTAMQKAMTEASFKFILDISILSEKEIEVLEKLAPMFDSQGGRKRRLREKQQAKKAQQSDSGSDDIREPVQQQPIGSINPPPMSIPARGLTPLQHQQLMAAEGSAAQRQAMALQESLQQAGVLRSQTPQSILQQMAGQQGFDNFQNGQGPMAPPQGHGHTRQSSRYTFANENPLAGTNVNARSNAAHMAEQQRMMPSQQGLPHQQLAQMYGGAPGLAGSLMGTAPPPGLKSAPTPPAPGLGGIPMGNMPGLGQFSNMGLKTDSENILLKELLSGSGSRLGGMRGVDGKRNVPLSAGGNPGYTNRGGVVDNYGDPSILQARVAQQPPSMQHQQNLQAGHGQPGHIEETATATSSAPGTPDPALASPIVPVSEEDFPALTPVAPPKTIAPKTATSKKEKRKAKAAAAKEEAERLEAEKLEAEKERLANAAPARTVTPIVAPTPAIASIAVPATPVRTSLVTPAPTPVPARVVTPAPIPSRITTPISSPTPEPVQTVWGKPVVPAPVVELKTPATTIGARTLRIASTASIASAAPSIKDSTDFSDTASVRTGTTESRPVTPIPVKKRFGLPLVGPESADQPLAVNKTKSAAKKERIAALKEKERIEAEELAKARAKEVQVPVVGRMKKEKKAARAAAKKQAQSPAPESPVPASSATAVSVPAAPAVAVSVAVPAPTEEEPAVVEVVEKALEPVKTGDIIKTLNYDFTELEITKPLQGVRSGYFHVTPEENEKMRAAAAAGETANPVKDEGPGIKTSTGEIVKPISKSQEKKLLEAEKRLKAERSWEKFDPTAGPDKDKASGTKGPTLASAVAQKSTAAALKAVASASKPAAAIQEPDFAAITAKITGLKEGLKPSLKAGLEGVATAAATGDPKKLKAATEKITTKDALDYLWNTVMPQVPELAQSMREATQQLQGMIKARNEGVTQELDVKALEKLVQSARKETELWEKKVEKLIKRNRKIVGLS